MSGKLIVATCQFAISADVGKNLLALKRQIKKAAENHADIVHFPECCLSGYAGIDFEEFNSKIEKQIGNGIIEICDFAKQHKI